MANLSSLTPLMTAATSLSNLILVTPAAVVGYQPKSPPQAAGQPLLQQPPAFLFHYEGEQKVTLKSDITDHFIEDNTAIQNQCALHPESISTDGFIGELNNVAPSLLAPLQSLANRLTTIGAYTPQLTATALIAYNAAFAAYQAGANAVNSAVAAWNSLSGANSQNVINGQGIDVGANQNKQQAAFQKFYGYWRTRTFFTVQTPWAVFDNVLIEELTATQTEETNVISDFKITFKLVRIAQSATILLPTQTQGQLGTQSAGITDLGVQTPSASVPFSTAFSGSYGAVA